jgi:hypothetical protein
MTAGIDWASEAHEVCISEEGEAVERFSVAHDERGIAGLARRLTKLGVARVAIERPDGILVERLLAAGLEVLAIHPNQVKAARARFAVAHGKSDRFDAYVLAELARTDAHRFRALVPDGDQTKVLKTLTRAREDLVGVRVELANQLRAQLGAFWPGALVFAAVDSPISLAFIERYPSPGGWSPSSSAAAIAAGPTPPSSSLGSRRPRRGPRGPRSREPGGRSWAAWSPPCGRSSRRSRRLTPRFAAHSLLTPTRRSSGRSFATPRRRSARRP